MSKIESHVRERLFDGYLSPGDAREISPTKLSAKDKKRVLKLLEPENVDPAALEHLGISMNEVRAAQEERKGLIDKATEKLKDLARDEVFKKHEINVADFRIGNHSGVKLGVQARILRDSDPLVQNDPDRNYPSGDEHRVWTAAGYGIYPRGGFGGSIPLGVANVGFGFSANASIGVGYVAPFAFPEVPRDVEEAKKFMKQSGKTAVQMAKKGTSELPLNADQARNLARGTEVTFRGRGRVAAYASIGAGRTLANFGNAVSVGANLGARVTVSKDLDLTVRVKRIGKENQNLVYVSLAKVDRLAGDANVGAHVGVDAHVRDCIPSLGGDVLETVADITAKQVDKQLEKWLSADLRTAFHRSDTEKEVIGYVLDLSTGKGRDAYDDLLKLDTRAADKLVEAGDNTMINGRPVSGASYAKLDETIRSESNSLKGRFGPITLLNAVSSAQTRKGSFNSTSRGPISYERTKLDDRYFGIVSRLWNGDRSTTRELVTTREEGQDPNTYYHQSHRKKGDRVFTRWDAKRVLQLANCLGSLERKDLLKNESFHKSFGKSDVDVDVYLPQKGLEALVAAAENKALVETAFAEAYRDIEQPYPGKKAWSQTAAPWLNKGHRRYPQVMHFLEHGRAVRGSFNNGGTPEKQYHDLTLRSLTEDRKAYQQMKGLMELVENVKNPPANSSPAEEFAKADGELGLDFMTTLAAIAKMIGPENILVNELSIDDKGNDRQFVFQREGAIQDIDVAIRRALNRGY